MALLSRKDILEVADINTEDVDVPEWGGMVRVRELTGSERDSYEASLRQQRGKEMIQDLTNVRAKLLVRAIVDEDGNRMFLDAEAGMLGNKSARAVNRVFDVVARLSGITDDAEEDAEKNSESDPNESSTSD